MFSSEANGYKKKEVDEKLNSLLIELTSVKNSLKEKDKLNIGLANALEKSKIIETSSKNLYELKTQKILILYKSLEKSFKNLFRLYPQIAELDDIKKSFDEFSKTVENSLLKTEMPKNTINSTVNTENDTIRLLLNKMSTYSGKSTPEKKSASIKRKDTPARDIYFEKPSLIKPIATMQLEKNEKYDSLADKFLEIAETENNAYTKVINNKRKDDTFPEPNESGFDLKEAINPKDDLSEIMKSFNFDE